MSEINYGITDGYRPHWITVSATRTDLTSFDRLTTESTPIIRNARHYDLQESMKNSDSTYRTAGVRDRTTACVRNYKDVSYSKCSFCRTMDVLNNG